MIIAADQLTRQVNDILVAAGVKEDQARIVASGFVESNLVGHDSHGVIQIPRYLRSIEAGRFNLQADMRVVRDHPGNVVIDADWGFGQVAASWAMELISEKARTQAVAGGTIYHCNDVSRLGQYSVIPCEHNCVGMMTVNDGGGNPYVAPFGSRTRLMSTNPISVGIPTRNGPPLCIDMSTSVVAGGKIALARERGEELPAGYVINADGQPSVDPRDLVGPPPGALLPLGGSQAGYKGFGLSLIVDILSGALSGAGCSGSDEGGDSQGVFVMAINVEAFTSLAEFHDSVQDLVKRIKALPRAEGVDEILLPGESGWREKARRLEQGIFIEEATCRALAEAAASVGAGGEWE